MISSIGVRIEPLVGGKARASVSIDGSGAIEIPKPGVVHDSVADAQLSADIFISGYDLAVLKMMANRKGTHV